MATLTVDITNVTEGISWSGSVDVTDLNQDIVSTQSVDWKFPSDGTGTNFSTSKHLKFPSTTGADQNYFTFRTQTNSNAQFPTIQTGLSLDVWSDDFHNFILTDTTPTWNSILGDTWNLSTDKFTLIYDYDNLYAPYFSKGGTFRVYQP
tara:strand:- start:88 stop:534 length:447 start_codon:yes stop_codon:yes gene_type:complete